MVGRLGGHAAQIHAARVLLEAMPRLLVVVARRLLRTPQLLGGGAGARKHALHHIQRVHRFAPHARLAADHQPLLFDTAEEIVRIARVILLPVWPGFQMIEVPARRVQGAQIRRGDVGHLLGGIGASLPHVHDRLGGVEADTVREHLLPDDGAGTEAVGHVENALHVVLLQGLVVGQRVAMHVGGDVGVGAPALEADLVAAQVDVVLGEHLGEFAMEWSGGSEGF